MKTRLGRIAWVVLLLAAKTPGRAVAASPADDSELVAAIRFRVSFGLEADPAKLAEYHADPHMSRRYGLPLTKAEESELARRDRLVDGLDALIDEVGADPRFGGLFFDQPAGGVVDIAVTRDAAELAARAQAALPSDAEIRTRVIEDPLADLQATQGVITDDWPSWDDAGVQIASVGVDVRANRVRVTVADMTRAGQAALEARYGPAIVVVDGEMPSTAACNSRTDCSSPIKGGLSITAAGSSPR